MWSPQRRGCMPRRATSVSSVCRFPFRSVRDVSVIVGASSRIGIVAHATMIANVSKRSACMFGSKGPTLSFAQEIPASERDYVCHQVGLGWSRCGWNNILCAKKKFLRTRPAIFHRDVCVRSGEYVQRSVPLLKLRPHGSGGSSRHDCQHFRAIRVHC